MKNKRFNLTILKTAVEISVESEIDQLIDDYYCSINSEEEGVNTQTAASIAQSLADDFFYVESKKSPENNNLLVSVWILKRNQVPTNELIFNVSRAITRATAQISKTRKIYDEKSIEYLAAYISEKAFDFILNG